MLAALAGGEFPDTLKTEDETNYQRAMRIEREQITEHTWRWQRICWLTAETPREYLELEARPLDDLARARMFQLYNT